MSISCESNDFTVNEEDFIPPVSRLYEPSWDDSINSGYVSVTIIPIWGRMYSASIPRGEVVPLLEELHSLNKEIEKCEERYRDLYYKKRDIPIIGRWLAMPVEKEGDKKLRDYEVLGRGLHDRIKSIIFSNMSERSHREMAQSRNADMDDFEKNLRALGVNI